MVAAWIQRVQVGSLRPCPGEAEWESHRPGGPVVAQPLPPAPHHHQPQARTELTGRPQGALDHTQYPHHCFFLELLSDTDPLRVNLPFNLDSVDNCFRFGVTVILDYKCRLLLNMGYTVHKI